MTLRPPRLDLRRGARVRWQPNPDEWREGKLVRSSPNNEEWLVENELGRFWIHVTRLWPAEARS